MAGWWKNEKRVLTDKMNGKRSRGRPRKSWKDSVKLLLEDIGVDWEQVYNRERWKKIA